MGETTPGAAEPLIYTSRGNVPIASLAYSTAWHVGDKVIQFTETYRLGSEVVKQSVHVYDREGSTAAAVAAQLGG